MSRILTEQALAISQNGHFTVPKSAIQPTLLSAELSASVVAVAAVAPVIVQAALPLVPDDDTFLPTKPDESTPDKQSSGARPQSQVALAANVDMTAPELPTQTKITLSAGTLVSDTPELGEFPLPRIAAAPPESRQRVNPTVDSDPPEVARAGRSTQASTESALEKALPAVAKGDPSPQIATPSAAPVPASPPQAPVTGDTIPKINPSVSEPTETPPSRRRAQSPVTGDTIPKINPAISEPTETPPSRRRAQSPVTGDTIPKINPAISEPTETPPSRRRVQSPVSGETIPKINPAISEPTETPPSRRRAQSPVSGDTIPKINPVISEPTETPPSRRRVQSPVSGDTIPKINPAISEPTETPPSRRRVQSPTATKPSLTRPIHDAAVAPDRRVQNQPDLPRPPRILQGRALGQRN